MDQIQMRLVKICGGHSPAERSAPLRARRADLKSILIIGDGKSIPSNRVFHMRSMCPVCVYELFGRFFLFTTDVFCFLRHY